MATKDVKELGSQPAPSAQGGKASSTKHKLASPKTGAPSTKATKKEKASNSKGKVPLSQGRGSKAKGPKGRREIEGHVPNAETAQVLREAREGKNLLHYDSLEEMYKDLGL
jgi:hypothetical protein